MSGQRLEPIVDKIIEVIRKNEDFLVLTHLNPDGDALGSLVALGRVLARLEKSRHLLSPGQVPPEYSFLAAEGEISPSLPPGKRWDVVFLLDTPCISRLPLSLSGEIPPCQELVNIDHHASNSIDGSLNWVDAEASSVGEMLFRLFERAGYPISQDVVTPLYAAILTDTGCFRFPNTTPSALMAAAQLAERGVETASVADKIYFSHSVQKYELLGEALSTLQTFCSGRGAFMWVTRQMLRKVGASLLETDGFENFPRAIKGAEVAILFKQKDDGRTIKVSLRSKKNLVDVSRVAAQFGGGGHPAAAGCIVTGSRRLVQEQVLKALAEELARADAAAGNSPASEAFSGE